MRIRKTDLEPFFTPKSIAIVGVSSSTYNFGGVSYLDKLQQCGFAGNLYPINPKATEIMGVKAYPNLTSLPEVPDMVIVCLPAKSVPDVIKECAQLGARYIHILTSGFKEIDTDEGKQVEEWLTTYSRENGLYVIGPNCMGPYCPAAHLTPWGEINGLDGPLGLISQSGGMAGRIIEYTRSLEFGIAKAISFGNAAVLDCLDCLEFMEKDDKVRVIGMYLEAVPEDREFLSIVRRVNKKKPIVMWKGGETEVGAKAAASHTGSIAGSPQLWDAFFRQSGVTRVQSMDEWVDALMSLALLPAPSGKGVFVMTGGGGNMVVYSDTCIREGLDLPPLSETTMEKLRETVPAAGSIAGNPLDEWTAFLDASYFSRILELGYQDPAIDMIIADQIVQRKVFHVSEVTDPFPEVVELMKKNGHRKPTVFMVDCAGADEELAVRGTTMIKRLCQAGFPAFPTIPRAVRALAYLHNYHANCNER